MDKQRLIPDDLSTLRIIRYPDPRLLTPSAPVEAIDDDIRRLVPRMFELMFAAHGVGLAAPQVGINIRLFVTSPSFEPSDVHVYINAEILGSEQWEDSEEGCLSVPGLSVRIKRHNVATIRAMNLEGNWFEETSKGLGARAYQHEMDHLNGRLIVDRMGSVAKLTSRRLLKDLEEEFAEKTAG
jgi:peptide deformylase